MCHCFVLIHLNFPLVLIFFLITDEKVVKQAKAITIEKTGKCAILDFSSMYQFYVMLAHTHTCTNTDTHLY